MGNMFLRGSSPIVVVGYGQVLLLMFMETFCRVATISHPNIHLGISKTIHFQPVGKVQRQIYSEEKYFAIANNLKFAETVSIDQFLQIKVQISYLKIDLNKSFPLA